jgi:hypothetical protein
MGTFEKECAAVVIFDMMLSAPVNKMAFVVKTLAQFDSIYFLCHDIYIISAVLRDVSKYNIVNMTDNLKMFSQSRASFIRHLAGLAE